jgi:RNA polymerase sigma-70 factor, ECF subfamily
MPAQQPPAPDTASDADLLAAIAARDKAAFSALFGRYAGRIKGFMMRSGASAQDADEIVQDVMVSIWRRASSFDPARAGAATWVYAIARNRRIDLIRRQMRPAPDPEDPLFQPDPEPDPADSAAAAGRDKRVREALAGLSDDQREVVRLAFYAGMTQTEIAEAVGAPLGTVKSRLRLAFARLRGALGEDFAEELNDD